LPILPSRPALWQRDPAEQKQEHVATNDEEHRHEAPVEEVPLQEHHFRPQPPNPILPPNTVEGSDDETHLEPEPLDLAQPRQAEERKKERGTANTTTIGTTKH
jgi:hypothetical protein